MIVDSTLPEKLEALTEAVLLCAPSGAVYGQFQPLGSNVDRWEPEPLSEAELQRREREPGARKLEDILADLEKRI